jgi:N-carbamoylputrescine amidase
MSRVIVAAIQTAFTDDLDTDVARVVGLVDEAAASGAQVVLPPELFQGHYFCQTESDEFFRRAHPTAEHPAVKAMQEAAARNGVVIPASYFERDGQHYYNSVAIVDVDGSILGTYRKSHIPDGPGYEEKYYFRPGNTGFKVWPTKFGRLGVGICWDQWFPEAARAMALAGAEVLLYPTAIGSEPEEPDFDSRDAWRRVMIGHAVANSVAVVAANRVGTEGAPGDGPGPITFYGSSFVCDARGDTLAELGRTDQGAALATIDLAGLRRTRASMGLFRDRRPDLYRGLAE